MLSPYDIACPTCGLPVDANCRDDQGRVLIEPHEARALQAVALHYQQRAEAAADQEGGIDRQAEDDYRAHSSSHTGLYEEP